MYINLALRVWCRALQGLTNQTETEGKKRKRAPASILTPYHAKTTV